MTRLVDGLERDGYVRRFSDPDDARGVLVRPTARGRRLLTEGRARRVRVLAEALRGLSADELSAIGRGTELIERLGR
jgi:DNA-binding MarR family transcriptional regulator